MLIVRLFLILRKKQPAGNHCELVFFDGKKNVFLEILFSGVVQRKTRGVQWSRWDKLTKLDFGFF